MGWHNIGNKPISWLVITKLTDAWILESLNHEDLTYGATQFLNVKTFYINRHQPQSPSLFTHLTLFTNHSLHWPARCDRCVGILLLWVHCVYFWQISFNYFLVWWSVRWFIEPNHINAESMWSPTKEQITSEFFIALKSILHHVMISTASLIAATTDTQVHGWGLLRKFISLIIWCIYQDVQYIVYLLNITFIFDRCPWSSAAVTPVKHECDLRDLE